MMKNSKNLTVNSINDINHVKKNIFSKFLKFFFFFGLGFSFLIFPSASLAGICVYDTDCPPNQICTAPPSGILQCVQKSCTSDTDCPDGRKCGTTKYCERGVLPPPPGSVPEGGACISSDQCANNLACKGGICSKCTEDLDCGVDIKFPWKCINGKCIQPIAPAPEKPKYKYEPVYPKLQIPIPGVPGLTEFAKVEIKGEPGERYIYIPWIGQYIAAIYGWAMGVVGILAVAMIVWGGVIYLTAGGIPERISTAKSYIISAISGLVLAFGSYLLLYTINPDLVKFGAMKIRVVERIEYSEAVLLTTSEDTIDPTEEIAPTPSFETCPIPLTNPTSENELKGGACGKGRPGPRTKEFMDKITTSEILQGAKSASEKIKIIAAAAIKCGIHFGSCGCTYDTIRSLAGASSGPATDSINHEELKTIMDKYCPPVDNAGNHDKNCVKEKKSAIKGEAYSKVVVDPQKYDDYIKTLAPGDKIVVFNANNSPLGTHSAVFVGWKSDGVANVLQGSWGKYPSEGTIRVKGEGSSPVVRIIKIKD